AKLSLFNTNAPNTTVFAAQTGLANNAAGYVWNNPGSVAFSTFPTLAFLTQQIQQGEDVEFGLYQHMMTLIGVGTKNGTRTAAIEYIDPNAPGTDQWSVVGMDAGTGALTLTNPGLGYGDPTSMTPNT